MIDITHIIIYRELRLEFQWRAATFIKLKKAIKDMAPIKEISPFVINAGYLTEQSEIMQELYKEMDIVSKDVTQIKTAINGMMYI